MELLQLQYFRTVARMEHMTKAAQELRIAQPALSKTIARLEKDVGVPLFDRDGRQIRLNTYGRTFLDKVEAALTLLEEGQREVADLAGLEHGSIHLAASTLERLSEPLSGFLSLHPKVSLRITQAAMVEMAHQMEAGELDLCFTPLPMDGPDWGSVSVLKEEVYLAVPPGHRLAGRKSVRLSEAAEEPFIGYKEGYHFQKMNDGFFRAAGFMPHFVCRVDEPAAIAKLVGSGLGVALTGGCGGPNAPIHLLSIDDPVCRREFQLVWHNKRYLSMAARKFRDYMVEYFAAEEAHLGPRS
ncbi:LysR family transcriptional regulator [Paenibacillus caseinilyticus]|uniref:LysR family transcriptional regulator n=1 Tax=Paenibacillus mucilaginosus K02 TaxID=997761 RepID=R9UNZ2_9BACL|nr:LysR family transcriptional regulator [Paenibacillus mucilaginosus]AGN70517.1 LysR family transcriptional regulator [Paenibacillus mucilaginosus K02]